ncbi:MAG: site-2 protease family protein [Spirochaetes bacterium]|nr:site-2 protease family protein [Spirochaetota bacterium]
MNIALALLIIGIIILVHEVGHFIAAKLAGIRVERLSIGFGPRVAAFTSRGTEYRLSLVPLGGYVLPAVADENDFFRYPVMKRVIFSLGGPGANILLAVILFAAINFNREGLTLQGVLLQPPVQTAALLKGFALSFLSVFSRPDQLSGIVGMVSQGGAFIGGNPLKALHFSIIISLNLAIFNLLPVPALDGGKVFLYLLEKIHPRMAKLHLPLAIAGWACVIGLMIYVTVLDIGRLV